MKSKKYRFKGEYRYTINDITVDEMKLIRSIFSRIQLFRSGRAPLVINESYKGFELPFLQLTTEIPLLPSVGGKALVIPYAVLSSIQNSFAFGLNAPLRLPSKDCLCDFHGVPMSNYNLPF